jgi:hypothetical protein
MLLLNKYVGKVVSCGALVLYCLNLPLEIRFLPENVFLLGMMPSPEGATVWTIVHFLDTVRKIIMEFNLPGQWMNTNSNPQGIMVAARILALIADLQASKKISGFGSITANYFCTYCLCHKKNIEDLNYTSWVHRVAATVREQAQRWHDAITITEKNGLFLTTGVRWTPMYDIPYWNPVQYVILGFMHNILEGVLQHHLRELWGIGRKKEQKNKKVLKSKAEESEQEESEQEESGQGESEQEQEEGSSELTDASTEEETSDFEKFSEQGSTSSIRDQISDMDIESEDGDEELTPKAVPEFEPEENKGEEEGPPINVKNAFKFKDEQLIAIRLCISKVMLPTWVEKPPRNLGEPKHGKLKAHQYLVLFTVILPLVLPELWHNGDANEKKMLECFCDLVASTNIMAAYSTSNAEADKYMFHFVKYRKAIKELHPGHPSRPNHHYAMHNSDQLKFWGPLSTLSEFPGERLNGELGDIPTNNHFSKLRSFNYFQIIFTQSIGDMELTMLRQYGRKAKLSVKFHDRQFTNESSIELANALEPENIYQFMQAPKVMSEVAVAEFFMNQTTESLSSKHYDGLLVHLQHSGRDYYSSFSHTMYAPGTLILPRTARSLSQAEYKGKKYNCKDSREGSSHVKFFVPGGNIALTGCIERIWELPLEHVMNTFLLVAKHEPLSPSGQRKNPYSTHPCSLLQSQLVKKKLSNEKYIIEPKHIITHLAVYDRPIGTFGIKDEMMVVNWSLNRGRQQ